MRTVENWGKCCGCRESEVDTSIINRVALSLTFVVVQSSDLHLVPFGIVTVTASFIDFPLGFVCLSVVCVER